MNRDEITTNNDCLNELRPFYCIHFELNRWDLRVDEIDTAVTATDNIYRFYSAPKGNQLYCTWKKQLRRLTTLL